MCGIVAVCGAPVATERLAAAVAALAHRGPDGRGLWRAPDGQVALGHTRLAVVAPTDGAQPVTSEDGAVVAVVNGEIYDAPAVGRALAARGHRLRGRGDAELLVHLYEEHGDRLVEQLRGELAFVLWDARRRRLVAARDRFGIKPLLWAAHAGGVVLASETWALWALDVARRWDDQSFFHAAHTQYPWPDRTLFDGVRQIELGGMLIWDGAVQTRRWVVPRPGGDVRMALDEAVRLRTVADAPVAVQLSGGVDSTAVAGLAARHRPDVRAFTVSFAGGGDYDEVARARRPAPPRSGSRSRS
jgi:asparagine synthase (glutamine-hydrolysing)